GRPLPAAPAPVTEPAPFCITDQRPDDVFTEASTSRSSDTSDDSRPVTLRTTPPLLACSVPLPGRSAFRSTSNDTSTPALTFTVVPPSVTPRSAPTAASADTVGVDGAGAVGVGAGAGSAASGGGGAAPSPGGGVGDGVVDGRSGGAP